MERNQCSSKMIFCKICLESKAKSETRNTTSKCSHTYCSECITKHIEAKLQQNISTITCLESHCKETLEPYICRDIISRQVLDRWETALCESSLLNSQKIYCAFEDCSQMLLKDEGVIVRSILCPYCNRLFCAHCQAPWHSDLTCDDFQEKREKDDMLLINLAKDEKWTRCPSCRFFVERVEGCPHMECRYVTIIISCIN
ncbi:hypothetical protein MKW92_014507 [Papaver armeniacum]|nr:hypothetical protein MKW92_014507 [Papaver armeniacum]